MSDINSNLPIIDLSDGLPGSTSPSYSTQIGGTDGSNLRTLLTDTTGILLTKTSFSDISPTNGSITALDIVTSSLVGANGQVFYFGTPTTNSSAVFTLSSIDNVTIQANILGGGGTLVVEYSMDGGSFWLRPNVYQPSTQNYTNAFTSPFIATVNTAGFTHVRVRSTSSWSGSATIIVKETTNSNNVTISNSLPSGSNLLGKVGIDQTTPGTTNKVSIGTDGTVAATQSGTWNITNISGTISLPTGAATSANQTTEITALQLIDNPVGSVAAGTAGTSSYLTGGIFNTTLPTLTNGQQAAVQLDSSGRLIVVGVLTTKSDLTPGSPTSATVGIASAQAVASNANRKGLILTNLSNNKIFLGFGATAVINTGVALYPGGSFEMDEYCFDTGAINAIASAASSTLAIQEYS